MATTLTHTAGFIRHDAGQIEARRPVVYQDHGDVLPLKFGNQVGLGIACQDDTPRSACSGPCGSIPPLWRSEAGSWCRWRGA